MTQIAKWKAALKYGGDQELAEALTEAIAELERCQKLLRLTAQVFREILQEERQRK